LTDIDQYNFIESGIRGGISQISKRYAQANNKYMSNYDNTKMDEYILYLDANSLYAYAMSQYLPIKNFKWNDNNDWVSNYNIEKNYYENVDKITEILTVKQIPHGAYLQIQVFQETKNKLSLL
jgi:hypothetical protein